VVWVMRGIGRYGSSMEPAETGFALHGSGTGISAAGEFRSTQGLLPASLTFPAGAFRQLEFSYEPALRTAWCFMKPEGTPRFTMSLMDELNYLHGELAKVSDPALGDADAAPKFYVGGSRVPGVFNLGGDLQLFIECIRRGDAATLRNYARNCIRISHDMDKSIDGRVITICVIQGDALGGGLEGALSFNHLIVEKDARVGLPESLFNVFPGMGAYSFLSRKIGTVRARELMIKGELFTGQQLHQMGLVTALAENGRGIEVARDFIAKNLRRHNLLTSMEKIRRRVHPVSFDELEDITSIWVDTAMSLSKQDLRRMEVLMSAQVRKKAPLTGE